MVVVASIFDATCMAVGSGRVACKRGTSMTYVRRWDRYRVLWTEKQKAWISPTLIFGTIIFNLLLAGLLVADVSEKAPKFEAIVAIALVFLGPLVVFGVAREYRRQVRGELEAMRHFYDDQIDELLASEAELVTKLQDVKNRHAGEGR